MATRGAIDLSFRADLSNLTQELAKMPNVTEKEAKEMVKALEKQFKSAEKAAERAAKKTETAFQRAGKGASRATKATGNLSAEMVDLGDTAGDADSALKGIGGAIGLISPEAERAFSTIGELGGGLEGMIRSLKAGVGPLAIVTAAVAAGAFAWQHYSKKLEEAEAKADDMAEAAKAMADAVSSLKTDTALIELEALVKAGEADAKALIKAKTERQVAATFSETRALLLKREAEALQAVQNAEAKHSEELESANFWGLSSLSVDFEHSKIIANKNKLLNSARKQLAGLDEQQAKLVGTVIKGNEAEDKNRKATKRSTAATKNSTDAIGELIAAADKFDPPVSELEQMSSLLDQLFDAGIVSAEAMSRVAPAIEKVEAAFDSLDAKEQAEQLAEQTKEAAKRFDDLANRANALAPSLSPLDRARQLMSELRSEIGSNEEAAARLVPVMENLQGTIDGLETDEAQAKLQALANTMASFGANITGALSNLAQLNLSEVSEEGRKSLERFDERAQSLGDRLDAINTQISASTDERVTAELEAERGMIEARITANEQAKEKETQAANAATAKAFKLQKSANLSQIAMNTAVGVMRAFVDPGGPAGIAFAATIGALGATQAAVVAAQEPPTMHLGGMVKPDERMIRARIGEGVLTQQGVAAIGGEAGLRAANGGAGAGGSIVVQQVYKHRVLDTVLTDSIKRGGPITAELNKRSRRGRRNPHRRAG